MAHEIFGNRFYGDRIPAWHNLGIVSEDKSAQEALTLMGGGYWFEKRPVTIFMNGDNVETGDFGIVRSPVPDDAQERNFGYVGEGYNIIQPLEVCTLFDENVRQSVETLGMLGKGERLFLTWKLPGMDIRGDEIKLFGFAACGYDGKIGNSLHVVHLRVVCNNTFNMALAESEGNKTAGQGKIWMGRHNSTNAARDLGIWMEHIQMQAEQTVEITKAMFTKFADTPVEYVAQAEEVTRLVYPDPNPLPEDYPLKLRSEKQAVIDVTAEKAENDRSLVMQLFGGGLGTDIEYNYWGLFNAFTEYENWGRSTKKEASASIMVGNRSNAMGKAFGVISDKVNEFAMAEKSVA